MFTSIRPAFLVWLHGILPRHSDVIHVQAKPRAQKFYKHKVQNLLSTLSSDPYSNKGFRPFCPLNSSSTLVRSGAESPHALITSEDFLKIKSIFLDTFILFFGDSKHNHFSRWPDRYTAKTAILPVSSHRLLVPHCGAFALFAAFIVPGWQRWVPVRQVLPGGCLHLQLVLEEFLHAETVN